ncbi:MAG: hypothetical protein AMS25_00085 [Gemmatimonas sp. SM23_52]|nr:MAG: hypothetical protein AMS25_00085 [Gemmatimonas sp. SM23_52]
MHSQRRGFTPHIAPLVAVLLTSSGEDVWGQEPEWIRLGTLVRVTTDSESPRQVVGVLAGHTAGSLFIIPERAREPTGFALMEITRLEINLKRETHSRTGAPSSGTSEDGDMGRHNAVRGRGDGCANSPGRCDGPGVLAFVRAGEQTPARRRVTWPIR